MNLVSLFMFKYQMTGCLKKFLEFSHILISNK